MRYIFFILIFIFMTKISADEVYLKDGRVLKGKIIKHKENSIELKSGLGSIFIKKRNILRVVSKKTPMEVFKEKYSKINKNNPKELINLAKWCKENSVFKYNELLKKAKFIILEQKLSQAKSDPDMLYKIAVWAKRQRFPKYKYENILSRVIGINPEHGGARLELGQTKYKGTWLAIEDAKKLEQRDFEVGMRSKGFIFFREKWVKPEEAKIIEEMESLKKQIKTYKKARDNALENLSRSESDCQSLKSQITDLEKEKEIIRKKYESYKENYYTNINSIRNYINKIMYNLNNPPPKTDKNYVETMKKFIRQIRYIFNDTIDRQRQSIIFE